MNQFFYPLLFIFGTAIGSFLNVVIWRYKPDSHVLDFKNLSGRSRCPYCKKELKWFELVPLLSFILQFGRCRHCKCNISFQYPIVEFITGLLFVLLPFSLNRFYGVRNSAFAMLDAPDWYYGLVLAWVVVFLIWLVIMAIDLRHYLIPNELNVALVILGVIITAIVFSNSEAIPAFRDSFLRHYALIFSPFENIFMNRLLGIAIGTLFFGALSFFSKGQAMGMGDVKLAFASAFALGWPDIGLTMVLAFTFGGVWGVGLLIFKKKTMHSRVPFAPFFVLGAATVVFFGFYLVKEYLALFNL